jgi:hypothetical protein
MFMKYFFFYPGILMSVRVRLCGCETLEFTWVFIRWGCLARENVRCLPCDCDVSDTAIYIYIYIYTYKFIYVCINIYISLSRSLKTCSRSEVQNSHQLVLNESYMFFFQISSFEVTLS